MKGLHHIVIETSGLKYEFDIRRNITVIQGDSATGKTTLIDMLSEYVSKGKNRGIIFNSDVPCDVYTGSEDRWEYELKGMTGSIVFIDEDYRFIYRREFAEYIQSADNYFVLVTRKPIKNLPYSINEIYGIRTSGKYHFPEKVYHEFYPIYADYNGIIDRSKLLVLVEDKESGYQFFEKFAGHNKCISAEGNANVYIKMLEVKEENTMLIVADGAAFGAYIDSVVKYSKIKNNIALYFPESFEWIILKSGVLNDKEIADIMDNPEEYIDSTEYVSWERFFTALLTEKTKDDSYRRYNKTSLNPYYCEETNLEKIKRVLPQDIRDIID